jgi:hypothetical protein
MTMSKTDKNPPDTNESTTRQGEDVSKQEHEEGRHDAGAKGASDRPVGKSTARDVTGVDPQDPQDPNSPNLI